jgi:4'-phosphopantetheinyl transferase
MPAGLSPGWCSKRTLSKLPINNVGPAAATLWLVNTDRVEESDIEFFTRQLGGSETRRLVSFSRPQRRRQFLLGRMLLRFAVADLVGLPVDRIGVVERPGNAPGLLLPETRGNPNFSLSHSRNWVACVVGCGVTLGLDIEVNDAGRDIDGIGEMLFSPGEHHWLSTLPQAERIASFYHLWCEREALHKLMCNLGCESDSLRLLGTEVGLEVERFGWHRYRLPFRGLSVVAVSNRGLFAIRKKILTELTERSWLAAAQHSC